MIVCLLRDSIAPELLLMRENRLRKEGKRRIWATCGTILLLRAQGEYEAFNN